MVDKSKVEKVYNRNIDEIVYSTTLESGLEVIYIPKKDFMKKQIYFGTKYGGLYNEFSIDGQDYSMPHGIAHFLEHQIFEGEDGESTFEKFGKIGGEANAFTSYLATVYLVACVDNFEENLKLLMEMVQNTNITDESVEKEKGIIVQEIKMYEDEPDFVGYFATVKAMYSKTPVNIDVAGTEESVIKTTKGEIEFCYKSFYSPENMFVLLVGDLDEEKLFDLVDSCQTDEYKSRKVEFESKFKIEPKEVMKSRIDLKMEIANNQCFLGFKGENKGDVDHIKSYVALKLANEVVFSRSGKLYSELYSKGYINGAFGAELNYNKLYNYVLISAEGENPEKVAREILGEIESVKAKGFSEKDFDRTKKKLIGRTLSSFNSVQSVASSFLNFKIKEFDLFEYLDEITDVNYDQAVTAFENFYKEDNYIMTIMSKD